MKWVVQQRVKWVEVTTKGEVCEVVCITMCEVGCTAVSEVGCTTMYEVVCTTMREVQQ